MGREKEEGGGGGGGGGVVGGGRVRGREREVINTVNLREKY